MASYNKEYDVAIIDEIQMLSDPRRGHNWTNALFGIKAKEIHLCGDERALELVRNLIKRTKEDLIVHEYARFSRLKADD